MKQAAASAATRPLRIALICLGLGALAALPMTAASIDGLSRHKMPMAGADGSADSHRPATVVRPLSCTPLTDVSGMSITTAVVEFPPGAFTPRHHHPGSVTAYILRGTLHSQLAGDQVRTCTVGQTWFDPRSAIHLFAENASATEPAEILATFITESYCGPMAICR